MTSLHHKKEMQEHLGNISNDAADKSLKKRLLTQTHSSGTPLQRTALQCWFVVVDLYRDSMSTETVMHWLVNQCSFIATNNLQQLESVGDTLLPLFLFSKDKNRVKKWFCWKSQTENRMVVITADNSLKHLYIYIYTVYIDVTNSYTLQCYPGLFISCFISPLYFHWDRLYTED